jgi:outer membrane protein OmpA-like peptidoglycan-associated protein
MDGDQFSFEGKSVQKVSVNGKPLQANDSTVRSLYRVVEVGETEARLSVATTVATESTGAHSTAQDSASKNVEYSVAPNGTYGGSSDAGIPVRNIPTFPSYSLSEGQTWSAEAEEFVNLSGIAIFSQNKISLPPLKLSFPVHYRYLGSESAGDQTQQKIEFEYAIAYHPNLIPEDYRVYPVLVSGRTTGTILFDNALGLEQSHTEEYVLDLVLSNGDIYEFAGNSTVQLRPVDLKPRPTPEPIVAAAEEPPAPETAPAPESADTSAGGPVAPAAPPKPTFDPIMFQANQSVLTPDQREKLDAIAQVLGDHPGDVLIEGFTAEAGTAAQQKALSEARAAAVAAYFRSRGVRSDDQIIVSGMGARKPLAPNDTPENRAQNRRAVILLLDDDSVSP